MKWISCLTNCNIPYYIYKLNRDDATIVYNKYNNQNQLIIILHGSIYAIKIFANKKITPVVVLGKDSIFSTNRLSGHFYYKLIALEKTYIISLNINKVQKVTRSNTKLILKIIKSYQQTFSTYQIINEAMHQKYKKNRVFQLILLIFFQFGTISRTEIKLPFKISQKNLAIITGTNKETINKIIKEIKKISNIKHYRTKSIQLDNIFNLAQQ
uniref:Global nitrogen transcriptional regulator n=1 Tax=Laurencieae sp. TaxID=2007162 RepID=A0A1Z1M2J5_9FLOR|nr:global nitrogen transcriptional regulator [Laurencieae sp.]